MNPFIKKFYVSGHVHEVGDQWRVHFLDFGGYEETGDSGELQMIPVESSFGQESVEEVDGHEECVISQAEVGVDVDQPVEDRGPHLLAHVVLQLLQVVALRHVHRLE